MKVRYFEKRGQWWMDFKDAAGSRRRVPTGCASKSEAERTAPSLLAKYLAGAPAPAARAPSISAELPVAEAVQPRKGSTITFAEAFQKAKRERDEWAQAKDRKGIESKWLQVSAYWGADTPLAKANYDTVLRWREAMLKEEGKRKGTTLSHSAINHRLSFVSVLLEVCRLPPHGVKHLSVANNKRMRRVREDELQAMLSWLLANHHLKGATSLHDLVQVALLTTARQGELLDLPWRDVYFDRSTVVFRDTKNDDSREVLLSPPALRILERRRDLGLTGPFADLDKHRITKLWAKAREALGLADDPEFVFHVATRHEGLSRAGETGANTFLIQALGGHRSVEAAKRYVKPEAHAQRMLVEAIANYRKPSSDVATVTEA